MRIRFSKRFRKQYQRLPTPVQAAAQRRLRLWQEDPMNSLLRVHRLEGRMSRFFSINITGDIRALYEIVDDEVYIFEMIGSHSQLYG